MWHYVTDIKLLEKMFQGDIKTMEVHYKSLKAKILSWIIICILGTVFYQGGTLELNGDK